MPEKHPACAECPFVPAKRVCMQQNGKGPENCPTLNHKELLENALRAADRPEIFEFARQCSIQESQGYSHRDKGFAYIRPVKPRIQEIIEFARKMDFQRLGLVFCLGLRKEASIVQKILSTNHFQVISVGCKVGQVAKSKLDLQQDSQVDMTAWTETMCNPIFQAYLVNHYKTEFNILLGLCVGHDSLFFKYCNAYCTVLAVKDRLLGHNPLAAVYGYDSYYRYLQNFLE